MSNQQLGIIAFTRESKVELEDGLATNELPIVIVSDGGFDYTDICNKYNVCYIHSDISIENYPLNEVVEVILNRICLGAAALPVETVRIFPDGCGVDYEFSKSHIMDHVCPNKANIVAKHIDNKNLSLDELFEDLRKW